uniref:ADC synthase I n=1 Tax=Streptoalloteichus sp. ATCC 53650 TaxID=756733 RepID=K4NYE6_9PSEU|nr:ADC synthase I [Streptoalloteichus sp. ATCC 53650]
MSASGPGRLAHRVEVVTESRVLRGGDAFAAFLRLRARFGEHSVFLLESRSGPASVASRAFIGIGPVLGFRVGGRRVEWHGTPALVRRARRAAVERGVLRDTAAGAELDPSATALEVMRAVRDLFLVHPPEPADSSFRFGLFGYLGYDFSWSLERLPTLIADRAGLPEVDLAVYAALVEFDLLSGTTAVHVNRSGEWGGPRPEEIAALVGSADAPDVEPLPVAPAPAAVLDSTTAADYLAKVRTALDHIRAGDIYQVQLGHELEIVSPADPLAVYRRLRARNPSPYSYYAPFGPVTALGASPELFLRVRDGRVTMKPIAGTAPRDPDPDRDLAAARRLRADDKEIAEHVMLVDLCRNDIGRVCVPGTLTTEGLLTAERYSHVHHLVSTVHGRLEPGVDVFDVIRAAFPAGTMTGAPKIRAMEIIEELETSRRGLYAGAIGLIDFAGPVELALCIRSAVHRAGRYVIRASAGVVADSDPDREWAETFHKLGALHWAVTGNEVDRASLAR